jgi:transcriptional regulator with XRE-family HTH domain
MAETSFPTRLRDARIAKGLSQSDLARMADIAPGQVNRYEAGKNQPRMHVVARLAGSLGVHPEWLHSGEGPRETGSTTAYSRQLDVTTSESPGGGTEIVFAMDDELHSIFAEWAKEEGMSIDELIKKQLLQRARTLREQRREPDLDELARKVKALIQADEPKD